MPVPALLLLVPVLLASGASARTGLAEAPAPSAQQEVVRVGATVSPGESSSIPVSLRQGDFLHLEVLQPGARLTLRLLAPNGAPIAEAGNPTEDDEPLPLSAIAASGGTFTFVLALDRNAPLPVTVIVLLEAGRPAVATDVPRIEAERLFGEGQRRRAEGTKEGLQAALGLDLQTAEKAAQGGDLRREAYAHADAGEVRWMLGELRQAREEETRAVELFRRLGQKRQLAAALNDLGASERDSEEPQAALEHYGEALAIIRELGDRKIEAALLHNIAGVYGLLRESERAIEYLRRALTIKRELHWHEAVTIDVLAMEYHELRDYRRSLRLHREALTLRRKSGDVRGQAITLTNMGWNLNDLGRREEARALYLQALAMARKVGDQRQEAILLDSLGKTLAALGRGEEALDCHRQALALSRAIGDPEEQVYALEDSAQVLSSLGRPAEALPLIEQALTLTEETRSRIAATQHRAAYSAHARERYDLLVDILWKLHQAEPGAGHDARALLVSERARSRGLLDLLAEAHTDLREGVDPVLLEHERAASEALERLATEQATQVSTGKGRAPAELEDNGRRLAAELEDVRGLIRAHSPRYAALVFPEQSDLQAIRRELDSDTLLLEYHLGDERSFLWVVGPGTLTFRELPARAAIESAVRALHRSWSTAGADGAAATLQASAVSRMLLGPVAKELQAKRLVIVADGALNYLPFAALQLPGRGPRLVVDEYEVVSLPSASVLTILRRESKARIPAPLVVSVFADPVFDAHDPRVAQRSGELVASASRSDCFSAHCPRQALGWNGCLQPGARPRPSSRWWRRTSEPRPWTSRPAWPLPARQTWLASASSTSPPTGC